MDFLNVNTLIIAFTVLVSISAFSNPNMLGKLAHAPYYEARNKEYYRWLTSGFLHGDYMHLLFNMLSLYFFGPLVEGFFVLKFGVIGRFVYLLFYLIAIVAASYGTYLRERNNSYFHSIGASGAVSAIIFASILMYPLGDIYIYFAIPIKAFIFAGLYLWYCTYAARQNRDNIDHMAHFYGAIFGFTGILLFEPLLILNFFYQIVAWVQSF